MMSTNNFSDEQANILMNHIKFMLNTNCFTLCIYSITPNDIYRFNVEEVSTYSINAYGRFGQDNIIKFNNFAAFNNYVNTCFKSAAKFMNEFFIVRTELDPDENPLYNSCDYLIQENYINNYAKEYIHAICKSQYNLFLFNFIFKSKSIGEVLYKSENINKYRFYDNRLDEFEAKHFTNQFRFYQCFPEFHANQYEKKLSGCLNNYRYNFDTFDDTINLINKNESCINNYLMPKLDEVNKLKYGENNKFKNIVIKFINDLVTQFSSKKIKFSPNMTMNYSYHTVNNSDDLTNEFKTELVNNCLMCHSEKALSGYFTCDLEFKFDEPISLQVKNTFKTALKNYLINNNMTPYAYNIVEAGRSKPGTGLKINFRCNDYKAIGFNPIKFLIPKLGAKSAF